ncbi:hypothetical protein NL528_08935 [Bradyrhizobium sp. Ash2021]|nr:hypothetical protein [Bradyrhizobium sp. Ash2021]WMT76467.1 hypothetical protein NL528_08935 [Bradyrhizobium sp. Ash2021]
MAITFFSIDQAVGFATGSIRICGIVFHDQLDRSAFESARAVDGLLGQHRTVALIYAGPGSGAGKGQDNTDLYRIAGGFLRVYRIRDEHRAHAMVRALNSRTSFDFMLTLSLSADVYARRSD